MEAKTYDQSGLSDYLKKKFDFYVQQRQWLEGKWEGNRADFLGEYREVWSDPKKTAQVIEQAITKPAEQWRSRATVGIVSQKVRAFYSILLDVELQGGHIPLRFLPSNDLYEDKTPGADVEQELMIATKRVDQAFNRCHAEKAFMDNAFTLCMLGKTYAKVTRKVFRRQKMVPVIPLEQAAALGIDPSTVPWTSTVLEEEGDSWGYVSNWECFADPEAAFSARDGQFIFHGALVTPDWLAAKAKEPFYISQEIEESVKESAHESGSQGTGFSDSNLPPYLRNLTNRNKNIGYIEGWGLVPVKLAKKYMLETAQKQFNIDPNSVNARADGQIPFNESEDETRKVYANICMANGRIVRFALADENDNPFYDAECERLPDEAMPRGVADNTRMGANMVTEGLRDFDDNSKWSGNVQLAMKRRLFLKVPDKPEPGGFWYLSEDARSVEEALKQITIQNIGRVLLDKIALGEKYADWDSMLPKLSQGMREQTTRTATETVEQSKNADSYTGSVVRNLDNLVEPIAERFYRNLAADPTLVGGKGDFVAQAMGFQSYQENIQTLSNYNAILATISANPIIAQEVLPKINLKSIIDIMAAKMRIDKTTLWKSSEQMQDEEQQKMAQQQQQLQMEAKTEVEKEVAIQSAAPPPVKA